MSRRFPSPTLPGPGETVELSEESSHHVLVVLQVPRGEEVVLFDGEGREARGKLVGAPQGLARVEIIEILPPRPPPASRILISGLPRKPAWETALRMATELGATEIRSFHASRSVVRDLSGVPERWRRIVSSAAGQCGRSDLPDLTHHPDLQDAIDGLPQGSLQVFVPGTPPAISPPGPAALLLGPEGGLTEEELEIAMAQGFVAAGLGPWTLRADTAVAAALARTWS